MTVSAPRLVRAIQPALLVLAAIIAVPSTAAAQTCPPTGPAAVAPSDSTGTTVQSTTMDCPPVTDTYAPEVAVSPGTGSHPVGPVNVTIEWNDNQALNPDSRVVTLNGQSVAFSYVSHGATLGTSTGTVTLGAGSNVLTAKICD